MHNQTIFVIAQNTWFGLRHKHALKLLGATFIFAFFGPLFIQMKLSSLFGPSGDSNQSSLIITLSQLTLLIGFLSCVFYASNLVETETNKRTISTVMIRPIHRWEFLCGQTLGVVFLFLLFVFLTFFCSYIASLLTGSPLPATFPLGILQRLGRGIGYIFIAASLGAIFSSSNTILIFVFFVFISLVFSFLPNDFHWSFTLMSSAFHYLTPAKLSFDFIEGLGAAPDANSFWIGVATLFENILYGIFVFILCCWIFEKKDLQLKEE